MRKISKIIVHCSDTPASMDIGADDIRRWHINDNGWADIGYHGVIRRDGTVEPGRPLDAPGAHCRGHNAQSVGICLVGGKGANGQPAPTFTPEQYASLGRQIRGLLRQFPGASVCGHRDLNPGKACPCFDVRGWWSGVLAGGI